MCGCGSAIATTTLKTKAGNKYCVLNLSIVYESRTDAGIPSGGTIRAFNVINREPSLRMAGIPEAATESILSALNSPVAVVVNLGDQTDENTAPSMSWKPAGHGCVLHGTIVGSGASTNVVYAVYDSSESHSVCG